MRRPPNGAPFVPPNPICPAEQQGHLPDLSAVPFDLLVDVAPRGGPTKVHMRFLVDNDPIRNEGVAADFVYPAKIELPSDSPLARKLQELVPLERDALGLMGGLDNTESPVVERMRVSFCERVANCQGVIDGECWALGANAVQEVIEQALNENNNEAGQ